MFKRFIFFFVGLFCFDFGLDRLLIWWLLGYFVKCFGFRVVLFYVGGMWF